MSKDDLLGILERAAAQLGEHFDSIQIHASMRGEGGGTHGIHRGCGDWYARQGLAHEFIEQDRAQEIGQSVARATDKGDE